MSRGSRLALDIGLFVGFLVAFNPGITGISVHEWLSIAIAVPALAHLVVNWDWVLRVTSNMLGRIRAASRLNLVVDAVLFVSTVTVMLSGLLVSQAIAGALGIILAPGTIWYAVHSLSATATIALLALHFGLHATWVVRTARAVVRTTPAEVTP